MPAIRLKYPTEVRANVAQGQEWIDFTAIATGIEFVQSVTNYARYKITDGIVFVHVRLTIAGGAIGPWTIQLPADGRVGNIGNPIGTFVGYAGGNIYSGVAIQETHAIARFFAHNSIANMGNNNPFLNPAPGHVWTAQFIYERS